MKRIAVISDTHDRYPVGLLARLHVADEIWHLGDVCESETLHAFQQLGRPMLVVLGNNETHNLWPLEIQLEREGFHFYLTHIPPRKIPARTQVVLHGHTHRPRDETDERGVRWLNPGCITAPRDGCASSFAWLELTRGQPLGWRVEAL